MTNTTVELRVAPTFGEEQELEWLEGDETPVEVARFGKDHWSTFAYVETRIMDYKGVLDHDHMRCDEDRHMFMAGAGKRAQMFGGGLSTKKYPTRLKKATRVSGVWEVEEKFDHDDYDCLLDAIGVGLLEVAMPGVNTAGVYVDSYGRAIKMDGSTLTRGLITGLGEAHLQRFATFRLTDLGVKVASQLRAHKSDGGTYHNFVADLS